MTASLRSASLRESVCRVGRSLFERGLAHITAGNISVRLPDGAGFLITPTDACLGFLQPDALAWVDAEGRRQGGEPASKTLALHRRIYAGDPAAHCVLHTHSTHLVALTLAGVWRPEEVLPPITPYFVMKVGRVPLVAYRRPGDPAVVDEVAALMADAAQRGERLRGVLCERLGPVVWQHSPDAAMALLEELEETARLWLMNPQRPAPLSPAQVDELHHVFGDRA